MNEQYYRGFGPIDERLEAWLDEKHDPAWRPKRRYRRDSRGRFAAAS